MYSILIVDDDKLVLKSLARMLRSPDYEIDCVCGASEALTQYKKKPYHLIIGDQRMPVMLGTDMFAEMRVDYPNARRILISAYADFESVTDAFNDGIIHKFVVKPWSNTLLKKLVRDQLQNHDDGDDSAKLTDQSDHAKDGNAVKGSFFKKYAELNSFHGSFTADPVMLQQFSIIEKAGKSDVPFFISGETGTGKELVARAIHAESGRKNGKFLAVNCANLTEALLESQLFGHIKGAFTGAHCNQEGLLSAANGGTLFLDEVTEIPLALQAKLLRVLQEREFTQLGKISADTFDAQIISASSTSLASAVEKGEFRPDLRYRLEVIPISLPPLRERAGDIRPLFEKFLSEQLSRYKIGKVEVEALIYEYIAEYNWPGNIRELINVCTYTAALADVESSVITMDCLPEIITTVASPQQSYDSVVSIDTKFNVQLNKLNRLDREGLQKVLREFSGRREDAARFLGVSRMTLWRKMKLFELTA